MVDFFNSLGSIANFLFCIAIAFVFIATCINGIIENLPLPQRKVDEENEELKKQLNESDNDIANKNAIIAKQEKSIADLQEKLKQQTEDAKHYKTQYDHLTAHQLKWADQEIKKLRSEVQKSAEYNQTLQKDFWRVCNRVEELESDPAKRIPEARVTENEPYQKTLENLQFVFYDQYDISKMLDAVVEGRLNNAFGANLSFAHIDVEAFIQSIHEDGTQQTYKVSLSECDCEYFIKRHLPCKHMLFLAYSLAVLQVNSEKLAATQQISIQKICENAQIISEQEFQIKKNEKKLDNILKKIKKIGSQSRQ